MSNQLTPTASAEVPSTQVTNPEVSVLDKTAQWHLAYERFNDYTHNRIDLKIYLDDYSVFYSSIEKDIILGIYDQFFKLGGDALHLEIFVTAVTQDERLKGQPF